MNKQLENKIGHVQREIRALNKKLAALQAECEKLRKDAELWEPIISEIHRRAGKEHAMADRCDFTVTVAYEDYAAIDACHAGEG